MSLVGLGAGLSGLTRYVREDCVRRGHAPSLVRVPSRLVRSHRMIRGADRRPRFSPSWHVVGIPLGRIFKCEVLQEKFHALRWVEVRGQFYCSKSVKTGKIYLPYCGKYCYAVYFPEYLPLLPDKTHLLFRLSVPLFLCEICLSVKSEDPIMNHGIINPFIMLIVVLRV